MCRAAAHAAEPDEERHVHAELDDLGLAEVLPEAVECLVGDREVVRRHQVAKRDRRALGVGQIRCLGGPLERAHERLGEPVVDALLVAHGHAASALVPERDAEPHELDEPVGEQAVLA